MPTATLVLFKAARTTAHLNENLRLLAAGQGERITTSYASRWLSREAQERPPELGETALVVLALYPYQELIPCRTAVVCDIAEESAYRQYALEVGPFVALDAREALGGQVASMSATQRPREAFLSRVEGLDVVAAGDLHANEDAWRSLTSTLSTHAEYAQAMFARVERPPEGWELDSPAVVNLRTAGARTELGVRIEASEGQIALNGWEQTDGRVSVELTPRTSGSVRCEIQLVARGQLCAPLVLAGSVSAPAAATVEVPATPPEPVEEADEPQETVTVAAAPLQGIGGESVQLRAADVRRILGDLDRRQVDDLGLQLAELALEGAPDDPEIAAAAASFLARAERYDEAAVCLGAFDPGDLPVPTLYLRFLAACKSGHLQDASSLMKRLDFATGDQFEFLKASLESLSDDRAVGMAYELMSNVLDVHRGLELYECIRPRLHKSSDVTRFAEHLWGEVSEQDGIDLLVEHTLGRTPDPRLLTQLIEYAEATDGNQNIGPQLIAETRFRIERGELDRLREIVDISARDSRPRDHLEVVRLVGAALGASRAHRANAVTLLCGASESARADGRVREAAELAQQAAAIAAGDEAAQLVAADAVEAARAALEVTEPLASLLAQDRKARIGTLREKVGGTTLRIVGGKCDEDVRNDLRATLGFKKVDWTESEKHQRTNIDWLQTVDPVQTIVVALTDAIGHATSGPLKERCQTRGIRHYEATRGLDAIVDALLAEAST